MTVTAEGAPARALPGVEQAPHDGAPLHETLAAGRGLTFTVLFSIVTVQVAWVSALLYGVYSLLR